MCFSVHCAVQMILKLVHCEDVFSATVYKKNNVLNVTFNCGIDFNWYHPASILKSHLSCTWIWGTWNNESKWCLRVSPNYSVIKPVYTFHWCKSTLWKFMFHLLLALSVFKHRCTHQQLDCSYRIKSEHVMIMRLIWSIEGNPFYMTSVNL